MKRGGAGVTPDVFDLLILAGASLLGYGGEQLYHGAGFFLAGAALFYIGARGPQPLPSIPVTDTPGSK